MSQTSTPGPRDGNEGDQESSRVQNSSVPWECFLLLVWSGGGTDVVRTTGTEELWDTGIIPFSTTACDSSPFAALQNLF